MLGGVRKSGSVPGAGVGETAPQCCPLAPKPYGHLVGLRSGFPKFGSRGDIQIPLGEEQGTDRLSPRERETDSQGSE